MFGSKRRNDATFGVCHPGGSPWDERTIAFIAKQERLTIQIACVERRFMAGTHLRGPSSRIIASGFLKAHTQHVAATISFEGLVHDHEGYGLAVLSHIMDPEVSGGQSINLPLFEIALRDDDEIAQAALVECHRDAILCGRKNSEVAVFHDHLSDSWVERQSDGTPKGGRFPLTGFIGWSEISAPDVPAWALPADHELFSLDQFPQKDKLRSQADIKKPRPIKKTRPK